MKVPIRASLRFQFHRMASAHLDDGIRIWDLETGNLLEMLTDHSDSVYSVKFVSDGKRAE